MHGTKGVLFGCFGRKIDGPGVAGGLIIYQGHLFPLKGHMNGTFSRARKKGKNRTPADPRCQVRNIGESGVLEPADVQQATSGQRDDARHETRYFSMGGKRGARASEVKF